MGPTLNMKPSNLRFSYGPNEKPLLVAQPDGHALQFNVSHSHGLGLCAVTPGREVGVDLEKIHSDFVNEQIPELFFSQFLANFYDFVPPMIFGHIPTTNP